MGHQFGKDDHVSESEDVEEEEIQPSTDLEAIMASFWTLATSFTSLQDQASYHNQGGQRDNLMLAPDHLGQRLRPRRAFYIRAPGAFIKRQEPRGRAALPSTDHNR